MERIRCSPRQGCRLVRAVLAVVGAAGSLGDFGAALPALARLDDRSAAVWFVNHLGPVYSVDGVLGASTLIGLLLMWMAAMPEKALAAMAAMVTNDVGGEHENSGDFLGPLAGDADGLPDRLGLLECAEHVVRDVGA